MQVDKDRSHQTVVAKIRQFSGHLVRRQGIEVDRERDRSARQSLKAQTADLGRERWPESQVAHSHAAAPRMVDGLALTLRGNRKAATATIATTALNTRVMSPSRPQLTRFGVAESASCVPWNRTLGGAAGPQSGNEQLARTACRVASDRILNTPPTDAPVTGPAGAEPSARALRHRTLPFTR